jgi:zinc transporter
MPDPDALIHALLLDGKGGARDLDWPAIDAWSPDDGHLWLHLDRMIPQTRAWLHATGRLSPIVVDAILAEDTRPRTQPVDDGAVVNLRGVNLNPGAEPDEMISLRMWVDASRLISVRAFRLMAVYDIRQSLLDGKGPTDVAELLVALTVGLADRVEPVIDNLEAIIDDLEDATIDLRNSHQTSKRLNETRRDAINLHRHLRPQRDALTSLGDAYFAGLDDADRQLMTETADRVTRFVEDLDSFRERCAVLHEEALSRQSEKINRTTYVLTLVATIFLPLGFVTGLLGINVGGIPLADSGWGFLIICAGLTIIAVFEYFLFRLFHLL